jgi:hypothetical protein
MERTNRGDGVISQTERRAYAEQVLRDVSLKVDGRILRPQLVSVEFPTAEEMKEGLGEIQIAFSAYPPRSGPNRRLIFENRHQRGIAAYLVNRLVPRDRDIRVASGALLPGWLLRGRNDERGWLAMIALVLLARFALLWAKLSPLGRRRAS